MKRVILIDDDKDILKALSLSLNADKIAHDTCNNPVKGIEMIKKGNYDVAVLDIKMPQMTGVELLVAIKKNCPMCQVIMLSSFSSMANIVECFERGAADFFVKPVHNMELFITAVKNSLAKSDRWRKGIDFRIKKNLSS